LSNVVAAICPSAERISALYEVRLGDRSFATPPPAWILYTERVS